MFHTCNTAPITGLSNFSTINALAGNDNAVICVDPGVTINDSTNPAIQVQGNNVVIIGQPGNRSHLRNTKNGCSGYADGGAIYNTGTGGRSLVIANLILETDCPDVTAHAVFLAQNSVDTYVSISNVDMETATGETMRVTGRNNIIVHDSLFVQNGLTTYGVVLDGPGASFSNSVIVNDAGTGPKALYVEKSSFGTPIVIKENSRLVSNSGIALVINDDSTAPYIQISAIDSVIKGQNGIGIGELMDMQLKNVEIRSANLTPGEGFLNENATVYALDGENLTTCQDGGTFTTIADYLVVLNKNTLSGKGYNLETVVDTGTCL